MATRQVDLRQDRFGNTFVTCMGPVDLKPIIAGLPKKAIILIGFPEDQCLELGATPLQQGRWLLTNGSNAPEFHEGQIHAAGVALITHHEGQTYAILVKDKTKPILTCPGGTCSAVQTGDWPLETALRELKEETGLNLSPSDLERIGQVDFQSTYYELSVPDQYVVFRATTVWPELIQGRLILDNPEIEYVCALPIPDITPLAAFQDPPTFQGTKVSRVHWMICVAAARSEAVQLQDQELFARVGLTSLRSIKLFL